MFSQIPAPSTQTTFVLQGSIPDTTLTTASGVRVFLTDTENLFASGLGAPVPCSSCVSFRIEVTEVTDRGDLIARRLPTIEAGTAALLQSGGMVQVQAFCNGAPLQLLPDRSIKIQIPVPANLVQSDMRVHYGQFDADETFAGWQNSGEQVFMAEWYDGPTLRQGYELLAQQLGKAHCARLLRGTTTTFCVDLPDGYSDQNSRVFLLFQGVRAMVEMQPGGAGQAFCAAQVPIGYPVKLVAVSKLGEQYLLGNRDTETGTNSVVPVEPQQSNSDQVITVIRSF